MEPATAADVYLLVRLLGRGNTAIGPVISRTQGLAALGRLVNAADLRDQLHLLDHSVWRTEIEGMIPDTALPIMRIGPLK